MEEFQNSLESEEVKLFDKTNVKDNDEGELLAYTGMLVDIKEMKGNEFTFLSKLQTLKKVLCKSF